MSEPRKAYRTAKTVAGSNRIKHEARRLRLAADSGNLEMYPVIPASALDQDERYTNRETMAWCEKAAGVDGWDLDVAACEESHKAAAWFDVLSNGLLSSWGGRVWCNPPFSDVGAWVAKAWSEMASANDERSPTLIAMLIPASRTEQPWWQTDVEPYRDRRGRPGPWSDVELTTHFLPGRTRFGHPGNPEGVGVGSPPFGCVLLVWRCR